jgi:CheY-like chemotaxis protein
MSDEAAVPSPALPHILLVEDHAQLRKMIARSLAATGYRVTTAEDGDKARELLLAGTIADLLLSDIRMPGSMNGLQLAAWVREHRPAMAIILQTGFSEIGTTEFTLLRKPYTPDELFAAINDKIGSAGTPEK